MILKPVEVTIAGGVKTLMYGVSVKEASPEVFVEMVAYAKSIGGHSIAQSIWFVDESSRTLFLLRWQ